MLLQWDPLVLMMFWMSWCSSFISPHKAERTPTQAPYLTPDPEHQKIPAVATKWLLSFFISSVKAWVRQGLRPPWPEELFGCSASFYDVRSDVGDVRGMTGDPNGSKIYFMKTSKWKKKIFDTSILITHNNRKLKTHANRISTWILLPF